MIYSDIIPNRGLLSFLLFIHAALYCKGKSTAMNLEDEMLKEFKKSLLLELLHQGCFLCGLSQNEEKILLKYSNKMGKKLLQGSTFEEF